MVIRLRTENKKFQNEINQLKNISQLNNGNDKRQSVQLNKSSIIMSPLNKLQTPQNDNNINLTNSVMPLKNQQITQPKGDNNNLLINQGLNIEGLSKLNFPNYPGVELSPKPFSKISGFGANSFQGTTRDHNEDRLKIIYEHLINQASPTNGTMLSYNISYFAVYDGHGGNKCSNFLQENLHNYIFNSNYFPLYTMQAINAAFLQAEKRFFSMVTDTESGKLIDKSGSCAVSALIMDEWCFIINLGDSRGLYSFDSGNKLFQITRDQKPNDPIEKDRIEKAGGSIYKDDIVTLNGEKVRMTEENLPANFTLPYRIIPGNISVSSIL